MRAVTHLNQANDDEKRTIKTETGASTASQDVNSASQSANEGVMPRRSQRHDQTMTSQENSTAARSKEIGSGTTRGGARKRKSEDVSVPVLESNKKCTGARMNAVDVSRNDRSVSKNGKALSFEERCGQLLAFKEEFGHCNVPARYSAGPSLGLLGPWCKKMRSKFKQLQEGKPSMCGLSQDQIERLEAIGFKWKSDGLDKKFEQRCHDLEAFKRKFGHCNVSRNYSADPSLGRWCNRMRYVYNQIQQGKSTECNLSQDRIERLEEIGFKWKSDGLEKPIDAKF